nr:hypothetical protein [Kofleriaceae bacterium]
MLCEAFVDVEERQLAGCTAYTAARDALAAVHDASVAWPLQLARDARRAAAHAVAVTAEGLAHRHGSAAQRRCVRAALEHAIALASSLDIAVAATGRTAAHDIAMAVAQHRASKAIALLGLLLHANFVNV